MFLASCCTVSMKGFFNLTKIQGAIFLQVTLISQFYDFQPITLILVLKLDYNMFEA